MADLQGKIDKIQDQTKLLQQIQIREQKLAEENGQLKTEIERALETLTPREADVVRLYFGLGNQHAMTLEEIGETFDLTRERVRQIKEKAIRRLKHTSRSKILKTYLG